MLFGLLHHNINVISHSHLFEGVHSFYLKADGEMWILASLLRSAEAHHHFLPFADIQQVVSPAPVLQLGDLPPLGSSLWWISPTTAL